MPYGQEADAAKHFQPPPSAPHADAGAPITPRRG